MGTRLQLHAMAALAVRWRNLCSMWDYVGYVGYVVRHGGLAQGTRPLQMATIRVQDGLWS